MIVTIRSHAAFATKILGLIDSLSSVSVTGTRDKIGYGVQVQYSNSPPASGGFGWNLSYADAQGQNAYQQASGTWRLPTTQLQAGVYAFQDRNTSWANATGSVVVMDGGVFAANRINDALTNYGYVEGSGVPEEMAGQDDADALAAVAGSDDGEKEEEEKPAPVVRQRRRPASRRAAH